MSHLRLVSDILCKCIQKKVVVYKYRNSILGRPGPDFDTVSYLITNVSPLCPTSKATGWC